MAVTTHLAKSYTIRMLAIAILGVVFGFWGLYDALVRIPEQTRVAETFLDAREDIEAYEAAQRSGRATPDQRDAARAAEERIKEVAPDGEIPEPPGTFDKVTQWVFVSCIPFGIWYGIAWIRARKNVWTLDDDGALHLPGGTTWAKDEIKDIDMSKWMSKSVATVIKTDGQEAKLDDYVYKNSHLIVGALAHERYPEQWHEDARKVKPEAESKDADSDASEADSDAPTDEPSKDDGA
ncbi:MAG: hypothetical protein AAF432_12720 [Planctomycetota bacterium]